MTTAAEVVKSNDGTSSAERPPDLASQCDIDSRTRHLLPRGSQRAERRGGNCTNWQWTLVMVRTKKGECKGHILMRMSLRRKQAHCTLHGEGSFYSKTSKQARKPCSLARLALITFNAVVRKFYLFTEAKIVLQQFESVWLMFKVRTNRTYDTKPSVGKLRDVAALPLLVLREAEVLLLDFV